MVLELPKPLLKPEHVVGPESTVVSICLHHVVWCNLCLHLAFMYHGARSGALRAPDLAEQSNLALGRLLEASGKLLGASGGLLEAS